jgi:hypothetical protein
VVAVYATGRRIEPQARGDGAAQALRGGIPAVSFATVTP